MNDKEWDACQNCGVMFIKRLLRTRKPFDYVPVFICPVCNHEIEGKKEDNEPE